jgi:hypothetical protein
MSGDRIYIVSFNNEGYPNILGDLKYPVKELYESWVEDFNIEWQKISDTLFVSSDDKWTIEWSKDFWGVHYVPLCSKRVIKVENPWEATNAIRDWMVDWNLLPEISRIDRLIGRSSVSNIIVFEKKDYYSVASFLQSTKLNLRDLYQVRDENEILIKTKDSNGDSKIVGWAFHPLDIVMVDQNITNLGWHYIKGSYPDEYLSTDKKWKLSGVLPGRPGFKNSEFYTSFHIYELSSDKKIATVKRKSMAESKILEYLRTKKA